MKWIAYDVRKYNSLVIVKLEGIEEEYLNQEEAKLLLADLKDMVEELEKRIE